MVIATATVLQLYRTNALAVMKAAVRLKILAIQKRAERLSQTGAEEEDGLEQGLIGR